MSDLPTEHVRALLAGRYRLDGLVGSGGMGEVHRAWDERLGRRVAVKVLPPELAADPGVTARLRAEGRLLASMAHPNLVTLFDIIDEPDGTSLVMELIDGESLAARLRRDGPLPVRELAAVATGIAAGLSALHGAGIVHHDVSPSNILLGSDGRPRLADLGLAQEIRPDLVPGAGDGRIHGTLRYLAPELLDGDPATPASDVYALAAVTYASLLGRPPAVASDVVALRLALREPPIRPSLLRPGLATALDELLLTALGPAPGRPTAYAFAVALANSLRVSDDPIPDTTETATVMSRTTGVAYRTGRHRGRTRSLRRSAVALTASLVLLATGGASLAALDRVLTRPFVPGLVAGAGVDVGTVAAIAAPAAIEAVHEVAEAVGADQVTTRATERTAAADAPAAAPIGVTPDLATRLVGSVSDLLRTGLDAATAPLDGIGQPAVLPERAARAAGPVRLTLAGGRGGAAGATLPRTPATRTAAAVRTDRAAGRGSSAVADRSGTGSPPGSSRSGSGREREDRADRDDGDRSTRAAREDRRDHKDDDEEEDKDDDPRDG